MKWVAKVTYIDLGGNRQQEVRVYDQPKRPQRTKVITDLVPTGCTTKTISINKKRD